MGVGGASTSGVFDIRLSSLDPLYIVMMSQQTMDVRRGSQLLI